MWSSRAYLSRCADLKAAGLNVHFEPGARVARGFADLGIEEFLVLPGGKLLSLINGVTAPLPEGHQQHFMRVPTVDELVDLIQRAGYDLVRMDFRDQRSWELALRSVKDGREQTFSSTELGCAFADGLVYALRNSK